jgi:hypothetical protein
MPSSYSPLTRTVEMVPGEQNFTWGNIATSNWVLLEQAIAGRAAVIHPDAANYVLTVANGAADEARQMILDVSGVLTAPRNVICPTSSKLYVIRNATTGGFALTLKTAAGTGVAVPNGGIMILFCDGTNVVNAVDIGVFPAVNLATSVSGVLPVANGGTGGLLPAANGGTGGDISGPNGSALVSFLQAGVGAVQTELQSNARQWVSVFQYMSAADIADIQARTATRDVTAGWQAAIAANPGRTLRVPAGRYKYSTRLDFFNVGIEAECVGDTAHPEFGGVEFSYYGVGYAMTLNTWRGQEFRRFLLKSYAANQSGVCVLGTHPVVESIYVENFDQVSFRVGTGSLATIYPSPTGVVAGGCYYAKIDNIYIRNTTAAGVNALVGYFNDGGFPSSNANSGRNITVNGRFDIPYVLNGTANTLYKGDCDPIETIAVGTAAYKIGGININVHEPYYETGSPAKLYWFDANSFSCSITGVHLTKNFANINSMILDEGWGNNVEFGPVGFNLQFPQSNKSRQNLIANSHFQSWDAANSCPTNWHVNSGAWSQDAATVRGAAFSVKCTLAASRSNLAFSIASPTGANRSPNQVSAANLEKRTLVASVWCKSAVAGLGNLKINTFGNCVHSGSGNWELLTAMALIPAGTTTIEIMLRSDTDGLNKTGDVWFSEPTCFIGVDLTKEEPRPLTDKVAQLYGPLALSPFQLFPDLSATPDVKYGNCFTVTNSGVTAITNFLNPRAGQVIYLLTTNANTTLTNNANIQTTSGANKLLAANAVFKLIYSGAKWIEY